MEAAQKIRASVADVSELRQACAQDPLLGAAMGEVKRLQSRRFAGTYADLLAGGPHASPARFFLEELYNDKDYAVRDAQFARIAGAVEKFFPRDVVETAVALAQLHAMTEELDYAAARVWRDVGDLPEAPRYVHAWRSVGRRPDRERQLATVLAIGDEMARLTRLPGLRLMLKMMRGPAAAAGLSSLQRFLESGFDTFAGMARRRGGAEAFLATIREREARWMAGMFEEEIVSCGTELARTLGQAR